MPHTVVDAPDRAVLRASQIRHRYPHTDRDVMRGVDLEVHTGERVAITGPSGSGKTTLLAILGGLLRPSGGTVDVWRPGVLTAGPADTVAWVLQSVNLLRDRTAIDNAALGAYGDGSAPGPARERARTALGQVGLTARAAAPVRRLSGGEAQRVVIARALASQRPFILADEPTGQLDSTTTRTVLDALLDAGRERGVVVVTHDPRVAERCDRILELDGGRFAPADRGQR